MLDLYRIFLCHPDVACHYKKFEEGASHVSAICYVLREKSAGDPAKMLALRCLCNMFKEQTAIYILKEKYEKVIEAVTPHLANPKNNIREAAITVLLNISIAFLQKCEDNSGFIQIITALDAVKNEAEPQCQKRLKACIANCTFKKPDCKKLAESSGFKL